MEESNWSDLSMDLLTLITDKLICIKDYIRFGATSTTWRNVFVNNRNRLPQQLPMLLFLDNDVWKKEKHKLFSVTDKNVYDLQVPMPHNLHCIGSSFGWLITVDDESLAVRLINPFLSINNQIHLPSLKSLDNFLIPTQLHKAILSANPNLTTDYVILIIYSQYHKLGFINSVDKTWTSIESIWDGYKDAIYYKDQFYAVHYTGKVVVCNLDSPHPKLNEFAPSPTVEDNWPRTKYYIVVSSGDLLQIRREVSNVTSVYRPLESTVFKLDPNKKRWLKVKSLHGRVLFLGDNSSMSVSASDFPGCKPNCIYVTDSKIGPSSRWRKVHVDYHIRVFNLKDGSTEQYYLSPILVPPPIWVEPTAQVYFN